MGIFALKTYSQNSSIKRMEFIDQLYKQFLEDKDIRDLYDLLNEHKNLKISIKSQNETALIKALTLFDKICNDYEQEIINKKALSYIAAEILDFYTHAGVQGYIKDIYKEYEYDKKKYKEEIRFYSGFIKLGKICEKEYVANNGKKQFGF